MKWIRCLLLVSVLLPVQISSAATEYDQLVSQISPTKLHFVAEEWDGLTLENGTGLYWEILRLVYEPLGFEIRFQLMPFKRAIRMVQGFYVDGTVGEWYYRDNGLLYPIRHLVVEEVYALMKKGTVRQWQGFSSLTGKKVGWLRGYNLIEEENYDFELIESRSFDGYKGAMDYLERDVIDIWMDVLEPIDNNVRLQKIRNSITNLDHDESKYDLHVFNEVAQEVYAVFRNTTRSERLIEVFDKRMIELHESGELQKLYQKWGINYPY